MVNLSVPPVSVVTNPDVGLMIIPATPGIGVGVGVGVTAVGVSVGVTAVGVGVGVTAVGVGVRGNASKFHVNRIWYVGG